MISQVAVKPPPEVGGFTATADKLLPQSNELPLDFYGFKFNNIKPIYIDNILTMP